MAKKKSGEPSRQGKYKPHKMVRVPMDVYEQVVVLAQAEDRTATAMIKRLLVEALKSRGVPGAG